MIVVSAEFWWSLGLVVLGLVLLVVFAVGALKAVRRTQAVQRAASAHVTGQVELIKGRVAAIRAEAAERRRNRAAG